MAARVELSKLVKEKRFWVASFLVAWAAALQVYRGKPKHDPIYSSIPTLLVPIPIEESPMAWHGMAWQGHMMWLQRQDAFKHKFGDRDDDTAPNNLADADAASS